jgi:hypothetical protein
MTAPVTRRPDIGRHRIESERENWAPPIGGIDCAAREAPAEPGRQWIALRLPQVGEGALRAFLASYKAPPLTLDAVYPPTQHLAVKVRLFIDFLVGRTSGVPAWSAKVWANDCTRDCNGTAACGAKRSLRRGC